MGLKSKAQDYLDCQVEVFREQVRVLESSKLGKKRREPQLTLEDYRKYLRATEKAVSENLEPTELIVKSRRKGEFF